MPTRHPGAFTPKQSIAFNNDVKASSHLQSVPTTQKVATAIVYCEGQFAALDGKTANGLIRHSEKYKILSVIDSQKAGFNSGMLLDGKLNDIPIVKNLAEALEQAEVLPDYFIFGKAPASGLLSAHERGLILEAMSCGLNIVNGLHEFLSDDPIFISACAANQVEINDIRKPRPIKSLRMFSGKIADVRCPRIAVLGTDCAIGKRTTAVALTQALKDSGIKAVLVGTGQTTLIQGLRYGVVLDAIPSQFCAGELEATIIEAYENEKPDVIIIEGQGALSHPALSSSSFILRGSLPDAVVLQHAPSRTHRCDFVNMPMPTPASEIQLIESFAKTRVIGLTINHEKMADTEVSIAMTQYAHELGIPVTDALARPKKQLVQMVINAFPNLRAHLPKIA